MYRYLFSVLTGLADHLPVFFIEKTELAWLKTLYWNQMTLDEFQQFWLLYPHRSLMKLLLNRDLAAYCLLGQENILALY
jgi:hypothetical protein